MQLSDFNFDLPDELIARYPTPDRLSSRLLVLDGRSGDISHSRFTDLENLLDAGDLLVFNDTKVIPARLWGKKETGGRIEVLVERVMGSHRVLAHVRASKAPKPGTKLLLTQNEDSDLALAEVTVVGRKDALFELEFLTDNTALEIMQQIGHMPLPPYIDREDELSDRERYQTVYAAKEGAVAAPTAGLHFSEKFIQRCTKKGVNTAFVTLHVGAGTFQPVRVDNIQEHKMHSEYIEVSADTCEQVRATRAAGKRVVAVGTTSVRSLESASQSGQIEPYSGDSDIFIYPGYCFQSVDAIVTNFHLPESTLIMLISAFAGREHVLAAYEAAINEKYRFFSYGDAMFVLPSQSLGERE